MKLEQSATDSPPIPHTAVCNGIVTRDEFLNACCACGFVGWNRNLLIVWYDVGWGNVVLSSDVNICIY